MIRRVLPVVLIVLCGVALAEDGLGAPRNLRCEYEQDPIGLEVAQPRLSWVVNDDRRGAMQAAYRIVVASTVADADSGKGTIWDSGRVESSASIHVPYGGPALTSGQRCYWSVRTWDSTGAESPWAVPAFWEMGLLHAEDWQARWITINEEKETPGPLFGDWIWNPTPSTDEVTRYFRKTIEIPSGAQIVSAKAWGAANNEYRFYLNGELIGGCDEWKAVESFDVTSQLRAGENAIALEGVHARGIGGVCFGMRIRFADDTVMEVRTDQSWLTSTEDPEGWKLAGFDPKDWVTPTLVAKYGDPPWGAVADRYPSRSFYLRKNFTTTDAGIARARVYASALGAYQVYINGQRVGIDELTPGWTYFPKHILYQTYDVTHMVRRGDNAIGMLLGNGWWGGSMAGAWKDGNLRGIAQLEIVYEDGARLVIGTDETWKGHVSPIVKDSIYHGETHDAQQEIDGWCEAGFGDKDWLPARVWTGPMGQLASQIGPTIRITDDINTVALTEPKPGVYVFDFGQNAAGRVRLTVNGPKGTRVQIRYAEILRPDGTLYTDNYQGAKCTDVYTLKGDGTEVWEPAFTYRGFRYAEVTGYPGTPDKNALVMRVMHTAVPPIGDFRCSEDIVNRVQQNILWGTRSNFYGVPTDCPQRDERLGWTGDIQVFLPTACWNMQVAGFMTKWMQDVVDSRNADGSTTDVAPALSAAPGAPGWADVVVAVPWCLYTYYGDTRIAETYHDAMADWLAYMRSHATDGLYVMGRYGDWVAVEPSPKHTLAGAYQYLSTVRFAEMLEGLGKGSEADGLRKEAAVIASEYNRRYFDPQTSLYEGKTQTANLIPLWFGIVPEEKRVAVVNNLVQDIANHDNHLTTGFLGTAYLMPALSAFGQDAVAGILANQRTYPSWGYMVDAGATTIWERWNSDKYEELKSGMNSFNHYAFGTVGQWYYEYLVGMRPLERGFKRILFEPHTSGARWAEASFDSMYGRIHCAWKKEPVFELTVTAPANTTALVRTPVPCTSDIGSGGTVQVDAAPSTSFEIGAGTYTFKAATK
ncbi:MAG: glycoside hydrolase family 78 protein [Candidatus Hydrogenedentes bacterium]|nr:glycoside hydrolase family 78 protein [Candidatus Hydrogenedentota bacterium]